MKQAAIWAAALGLIAFASAAGWDTSAAKSRKKKPAQCVRFSEDSDGDAPVIHYSLENRCQKQLSCKLSWTVVCDPGGESSHEESSVVIPGDTFSVDASASQCDKSWTIAQPRWSCQTER